MASISSKEWKYGRVNLASEASSPADAAARKRRATQAFEQFHRTREDAVREHTAPGGSRTPEEARRRIEVDEAQDEVRSLPPEMRRARRDAEASGLQTSLGRSRTSPLPPSTRRQAHRGPGVDMSNSLRDFRRRQGTR